MSLRPDLRVDVWFNQMEGVIKAQVMERSTYRRLNIVFDDAAFIAPVQSIDFHRGLLDGLVRRHGDTFNWLFIGLAPTKPSECPPEITFEVLNATTKYLNS
ncbi:hypothetical protein PsPphi15_gp11 [Pseudomonas phage phi15]|uniref:Uncharacterized protein n=1 Tax=Pseudomonas phage phi15 TaxID=988656 RepID=F0V6X2_9CAUD|nr:hypothetical protein PsPphi15_gp11 [Pseudomonas phage phi15]CBZ41984.1 hypothetical protein [Pseudomonas phage phi15]